MPHASPPPLVAPSQVARIARSASASSFTLPSWVTGRLAHQSVRGELWCNAAPGTSEDGESRIPCIGRGLGARRARPRAAGAGHNSVDRGVARDVTDAPQTLTMYS